MKIRVLGGGWYGCHIAVALVARGYDVELHELTDRLFAGASGANPARLHLGFHYPRSQLTRAACQANHREFMQRYGFLTRTIPTNIYAVASTSSLVDFGTYCQVLRGEVDFVTLEHPEELGLVSIEGAVLTGERHILIAKARAHFTRELGGRVRYNTPATLYPEDQFDQTIDCTFCAQDATRIDRFEPCITGLLRGPIDRAVTIMDGPFPSVYPWDEHAGLSSITSAKWTPLERCKTWEEARGVLVKWTDADLRQRVEIMRCQMAEFWPQSLRLYKTHGYRTGIRAMPASGADARLVDIVRTGARTLRVRAGKIDSVVLAEHLIAKELDPGAFELRAV